MFMKEYLYLLILILEYLNKMKIMRPEIQQQQQQQNLGFHNLLLIQQKCLLRNSCNH